MGPKLGPKLLKLGIVSDIHCNAAGLSRALELMGDVDELICLGDSIWEYRFSNEVARILKESRAHTILGNHEEVFFGPLGERARARPDNDRMLMDWLASRPHRDALDCAGKRVLLVHSTPWEPRGAYIYPDHPELARFGEADADFVLYGHTHRQLARRFGRVLVVNPGSAGDARDHGNGRQLSCAVLDTVSEEARIIDFPDPRRDE
jgi:putative phosphoesterase